MEFETKVKCPYCACSVPVFFSPSGAPATCQAGHQDPLVIACAAFSDEDPEQNLGCDKDFVVYPYVSIKATAKKIA